MPKMTLEYDAVMPVSYEKDGHYHIFVPTFYELKNNANEKIDFVFDTGAFITVITRQTAIVFGFDKLPPRNVFSLTGYTGSCLADVKAIPGIIIGGRRLEDVKVAIPHENSKHNLLGLNVLEYFNYFFDNENSKIYFSGNQKYKAPNELMCGKVYMLSII